MEMAVAGARRFGLPVKIDPHQALLDEVHRTVGHVVYYEEQLQTLSPDALVWGTVKKVTETPLALEAWARANEDKEPPASIISTIKQEEAAQMSVWLKLYKEERAHLVEVCRVAIACGLAERFVRLSEEQSAMMVRALRAVFGELGIDPDDSRVREVVRRQLLLVSGEVTV
jgi:hypothetical protein